MLVLYRWYDGPSQQVQPGSSFRLLWPSLWLQLAPLAPAMPATRFERNGAVVGGAITVSGEALVAWWSPTETTTINNGEQVMSEQRLLP